MTTKARTKPPTNPPADPPMGPPTTPRPDPGDVLARVRADLRDLKLPTIRDQFEPEADRAAKDGRSYPAYLAALTAKEIEARTLGRIRRLLRASRLPLGKTWDAFPWSRVPVPVARQCQALRDGGFLARKENVLVFGPPGSGKTHVLAALGDELVSRGHSVLFVTCSLLVQDLLAAKRDLRLERLLKKLSGFEALVIDDLGYVQQSREEMEVLFTLLAERYERGSVLLTSNLAFSQWGQIFKDPMTTAAAIDRLVHHSVIVELNVPSDRLETAKESKRPAAEPAEAG